MTRSSPPRPPARQRLLTAAARVFAREGLVGATTRAIAREAGVNEVTLFRHFQTKDRLLAAVVGQNFGPDAPQFPPPLQASTGDLRADLTAYAKHYEKLLQENLPLIRTMLAEIHHHADHERHVFKAVFRPLRDALVARLAAARSSAGAKAAASPEILADLFGGMIFTGVLRRASAHLKRDYSAADYLAAAVDLLARGAAG